MRRPRVYALHFFASTMHCDLSSGTCNGSLSLNSVPFVRFQGPRVVESFVAKGLSSMANAVSSAWDALIEELAVHVPNARDRAVPPNPDLDESCDSLGQSLPPSIVSLYRCTDGIDLSGYLPDYFSLPDCTFSLIPSSEIRDWHATLLENHRSRGGLWPFFPHWLKACTAHEDADGIWHERWIPFATDGGAGVQFVRDGIRGGVYQYSPETFGIRRCAAGLPQYLRSVSKRLKHGTIKPLDLPG